MATIHALGQIRLHFSGLTDVGQVRSANEDNLLLADDMPLIVVADGMGGHASGEVASELAVTTIHRHLRASVSDEPPSWPYRPAHSDYLGARLASAVKLANVTIFQEAAADASRKGMGCTVEALLFSRGYYFVGHVGDSRVYLVREQRLEQITEDHSLLNDYRHMRDMSPEEIEAFPHKNVVVRALGLADSVNVDVRADAYLPNDLFLLCSDGLSDMLSDAQILAIALRFAGQPDEMCARLVQAANAAGGKDNITAAAAWLEPIGV